MPEPQPFGCLGMTGVGFRCDPSHNFRKQHRERGVWGRTPARLVAALQGCASNALNEFRQEAQFGRGQVYLGSDLPSQDR